MPATDTSGVSRVATQPAGFVPSFSNTGTAVFFQDEAGAGSALISGDRSQPGAILKITRIVDDNAQNFHARPSPDGSRIAFDSDREGTRAVFVADADGEHVRRMSGDGFAALPSWSPGGKQLAFVKAEADKPRVWISGRPTSATESCAGSRRTSTGSRGEDRGSPTVNAWPTVTRVNLS